MLFRHDDPYRQLEPTQEEQELFARLRADERAKEWEREIAPGRAAVKKAEAEKQAAAAARAAADARREQLCARAADAARVWTRKLLAAPDAPLDPLVIRLQRHVIDLALEAPEITIDWLDPKAASTALVRPPNAVSFAGQRHIVCPPIMNRATAAVALHELGHARTEKVRGKYQREAAAWRWARAHALEWTPAEQKRMVECVESYIQTAGELRDVPALLELEQLIAPLEYRRERQRRVKESLAAERGQA